MAQGGFGFYASAIFQFVVNAQDASIGQVAKNLTVCSSSFGTMASQYGESVQQRRAGQYTLSAYSLNDVLRNIDPIVFSCFFTVFEYSDALSVYVGTLTNFDRLVYNAAHNLGNIYDLIEEAWLRWRLHTDDDPTNGGFYDLDWWARSGYIAGAVFQDLF